MIDSEGENASALSARWPIERVSLELGRRCSKGCWFCYNGSNAEGERTWEPEDVVAFARDCAAHDVKALSFGGGEPLEEPSLFAILRALDGILFRSLTTNGLPLEARFDDLVAARPDKVHVSIHFPGNDAEVGRVIAQVGALAGAGIKSGVNLLVRASTIDDARTATSRLYDAGIGPDRIVFLPMRGEDTPTPAQIASVAGPKFQSMSCLSGCGKSPRFCSIGWDRSVAWCSYTTTRAKLAEPTWAAMLRALEGLGLRPCGLTQLRV